MRRIKLTVGVLVAAFSSLVIVMGLRGDGTTGAKIGLSAFFAVVTLLGAQLAWANWKQEREHVPKLEGLLDRAAAKKKKSSGPGGPDTGDKARQ